MSDLLGINNKKQLVIIFIWVGAWGLIETGITKFVPYDKYNIRLVLYFVMLVLAVILFNYYNKQELTYLESRIKNMTINLKQEPFNQSN